MAGMNRGLVPVACLAVLAVAAPAAQAANAPHVQQRIVPGRAIGKVKLEMTVAQVQRVLGRHESVNYDEPAPFGRRFRELAWNFGEWRIGFVGKPGALRVVRIEASVRDERTRSGLGVGTPETRIESAYRTTCFQAWYTAGGFNPGAGKWCRAGAGMYFVVDEVCQTRKTSAWECKDHRWRSEVTSVVVTSAGPPPYVRITNDPGP